MKQKKSADRIQFSYGEKFRNDNLRTHVHIHVRIIH